MSRKIRFVLTRDLDMPIGGIKQIYRQTDILNENGFDAAVVVQEEGFRCTWFNNRTRVIAADKFDGLDGDFVVLSELVKKMPKLKGIDSCRVAVYAQNPFGVLEGYGGIGNQMSFYKSRVDALMCVSEHSERVLPLLVPWVPIHRIRYSFDREPFGLG